MRIVLLSVGRERADPTAPLVADYLSRIRKRLPVEEIVLKAEREDRLAARMLRARRRGELLVALDERGRQLGSIELAERVQSWMNRAVAGVCFAVGGANGLPARVSREADERLALSRLTLPHRIARLVLAEQLYRALEIQRGSAYHK